MSTTTTHQPQRHGTRAKGVVAAAAGVALLLGGSSFALWSDTSASDAGTISSGNFQLSPIGAASWQDVSADLAGGPRDITLDDFRIIPGDTIAGTFGIDAGLEGDNLLAEIGLGLDDAQGDLLADTEGVRMTYTLQKVGGAAVPGATDVPVGQKATVKFASADNAAPGTLPTLPAAADGVADYEVVVKATFDEATPDTKRVLQTLDLGNLAVTMKQARPAVA